MSPHEPDGPAPAAYLDCTLGVAGDMLLGALVDAGAAPAAVTAAIGSMGLPGASVRFERTRRAGFACTRAIVDVADVPDRERTPADVIDAVCASTLAPRARKYAMDVFSLLAEAEAAVHGCRPGDVRFHEVGAHDALCDVVGCAAALNDLGLLRAGAVVSVSDLAVGSGLAVTRHGRIPVPAPAVAELARRTGAGLVNGDLQGERSTPTGTALVLALARSGPLPAMSVTAVGCGGGRHDFTDSPNITRVIVGTVRTDRPRSGGSAIVVESTVDDLDPRLWPAALAAIRAAGSWDCWTCPIVGRGGRPGHVVTALCSEQMREAVMEAVFRNTGSLGVRWSAWQRCTLPRRGTAVHIGPGGGTEVAVKLGFLDGDPVSVQPELADVQAAAVALGRPVREILGEAMAAYLRQAMPADAGTDAP
jgi:pyridinium-3,5-bisthiocarboxylic acid mononucleotide nickel chelatase